MALDFVQNPPLKVTLATSSSRLITSPVIFNRTIGEIYGMLSGKDPARRNDARHIYEALECRLPSRLTVPSARDSGAPVARGARNPVVWLWGAAVACSPSPILSRLCSRGRSR